MTYMIDIVISLFVLIVISAFIYIVIYPMFKKGGVVRVAPYQRARPKITDRDYGRGEVIGITELGKDKFALKVKTDDTIYNIPYYNWEIEPMNIKQALCGNGSPEFIALKDKEQIEGKVAKYDTLKLLQKYKSESKEDKTKVASMNREMDEKVNLLMDKLAYFKKQDQDRKVIP